MKTIIKPYTFGVVFISVVVIFLSSATAYWVTINGFFRRNDGDENLPIYEETLDDLTCKIFPEKNEFQTRETISLEFSLTGITQKNPDLPSGLEDITLAENLEVDWGDGTTNTYASIKEPIIHVYQSPGTYQAIGKVTYRHKITNETVTVICKPYTYTRFKIT